MHSSQTQFPIEVDVRTVSHWLSDRADQVVLIDCREESEYATAKIDSAVLLPMSQWGEVSNRLGDFHGKHLIVHCHHGGRSLRVAHWLRENGFPEAQSMAGGIDEWSLQIDPTIPRY
jgi:rhodanese-related sulfurtransferase